MPWMQWLRASGAVAFVASLNMIACGERDEPGIDDADSGGGDTASGVRDTSMDPDTHRPDMGSGGARSDAAGADRSIRDSTFVCPTNSTQLGNLNGDPCTQEGLTCAACRGGRGGYRSCTCTALRWACMDSDEANPTLGCQARPEAGGPGGSRDGGSGPGRDSGPGPRGDSGRADGGSGADADADAGGPADSDSAADASPDGAADVDASIDILEDGRSDADGGPHDDAEDTGADASPDGIGDAAPSDNANSDIADPDTSRDTVDEASDG
ncbi:MAG TPA: hypothetical protein VK550_34940 [Polyangiaceae bacterium]|nr:hypothetical protein [Polyangiaceae bacterium]